MSRFNCPQYLSTLEGKMIKILITLLLIVTDVMSEVIVVTGKGLIRGNKHDGYNTFFGIPYAMVDESNPFRNSLQYPDFEKPFIANDSNIVCPQTSRKGILQCLRLNMYVPHRAHTTNNSLPILVWFYGGGFLKGGVGDYGGQYLVKHDIIVITVNYRLGPYGFMCLDDTTVPGNQGLKDQIAALRWIKNNIAAFGGNASEITIAGQSYGGGAVDLHLYSKYETLFDKAIIQSGSMFTPNFMIKRDYDSAIQLAIHLGHNVTNTKDAIKELAKENPDDVMAAFKESKMKLSVCKETQFEGVSNFVTKVPCKQQNEERIRNITIMIGYNSKEDFATYANKPQTFYDNLSDMFYTDLKKKIFARSDYSIEVMSKITKEFYLGSKSIGPESVSELSDYSSDYKLNFAVEMSVQKYMEQGAKKVYKYLFSYIGDSAYKNMTGVGAIHSSELKYLFKTDSFLATDENFMMRDRMTAMWANFVKYGNPTPQKTDLLPVTWEPVTGTTRPYLNIDVNMTMQDHVFQQRMAFWTLLWHVSSPCSSTSSRFTSPCDHSGEELNKKILAFWKPSK